MNLKKLKRKGTVQRELFANKVHPILFLFCKHMGGIIYGIRNAKKTWTALMLFKEAEQRIARTYEIQA